MISAEAPIAEAPAKPPQSFKSKPWEPREKESTPAFTAFAIYRDLGPERSLNQVRLQLGKSEDLIWRWSSRWSWVERAKAFDAHLDAIRTSAREQALAKRARKIMSADEVKEGLTRIAESDIAEVFEADGSFDLAAAKSRGATKLIKSLSFDKDTRQVVKVECYSSHEGHRDMAKIHGLFVDKVETLDKTPAADPAQILSILLEAAGLRPLTPEQLSRVMAVSVQRMQPVIDVTPERVTDGTETR